MELKNTSFFASCASAWTPDEGIRAHHIQLSMSASLVERTEGDTNRKNLTAMVTNIVLLEL